MVGLEEEPEGSDEGDGDDFLLETSLAEILIPLLGSDGR